MEGEISEGGKRSAWMTHLKKTMRAHKGLPLRKAMVLAKKTYKKSRRGGAALSPASVSAGPTGGRRRSRSRRHSRKH
jgi:hypothetical protein